MFDCVYAVAISAAAIIAADKITVIFCMLVDKRLR
jgi:hypothetical protein